MNGGFRFCGVVSVGLELVLCDAAPVQYPTVKPPDGVTRIPAQIIDVL